jgi:hypothetical protein
MQNQRISGAVISPRTGIYGVLDVNPATLKEDLMEDFIRHNGLNPTWDLVEFHNSIFTVYTFMPKNTSGVAAIPDSDIEHHIFKELGFPQCPLYTALWVCGTTYYNNSLASFTETEYDFIMSLYHSWYSKPAPAPLTPSITPRWSETASATPAQMPCWAVSGATLKW